MISPNDLTTADTSTLGRELRRRVQDVRPDVLPDSIPSDTTRAWFYAPGDFEAAALERVIAEGYAVNRHVDYSTNFSKPAGTVTFRVTGPAASSGTVAYTEETNGTVDGQPIAIRTLQLPGTQGLSTVEVTLRARPGLPAAVSIDETFASASVWEVQVGETWNPVRPRLGGHRPPHTHGEPEFDLELLPVAPGMYAAPAPVLARLTLEDIQGAPSIRTGESWEEALAPDALAESRHDIRLYGDSAVSEHRLGFRFVHVSGGSASRVTARVSLRPAPRRGAFAASDDALTDLWATGAFTLRSCLQTFVVDGIKRDRMPWAGDNALAVLTNAYAFADPQPTRDTLTALGRPRDGYINGIADYSLWWLISHDLFQVYFEDRRYLGELAPHIVNVLDGLIEFASPSDGLLRTSDHPEQFAHAGPGGIFLDWGLDVEAGRVLTATQILWFWALRGAGRVLTIAGHPAATRAEELADKLSSTLREQAWDSRHERWSMYLGGDEISAYPNFLAPIAQLQPPEGAATNGMQQAILSNSAGTPFMRTFGLLGLARLGGRAEALSHLRRMWGGMQNEGSATFWEEFSSDDASPWEMYGRPFGKSLTHAWSAGPAAALPTIILGLEPVADGWREVSLSPDLGDLDWAGAVVPTPRGDIEVLVDRERVVVNLPADTTLLYGENRYSGSVVIPVDSVDASVE